MAGLLVLAFIMLSRSAADTASDVDLVLVLAMDVSSSVDAEEFSLQRDGLARAISAPQVLSAIQKGQRGRVALSVVQWSGFTEQEIKIGWTVLATRDDVSRFTAQVSAMTRRYDGGATDIGGALQFTRNHVLAARFTSARRVVDISGDGKNNVNASPAPERDKSVSAGVNINGLAITKNVPALAEYYRHNVIGGPGSFVEEATSYRDYERAIKRKLLREIGAPFLS
ncbi:MAG: DUF1194 domain-containing protein [Rhodobacteraceae bacterium]|nr:DUF1194 domain-containing protein [Paracoccaceae bacterium]